MLYGRYKSIRDSAWQCLADFEISKLPVDTKMLARKAGIVVLRNSMHHSLKNNELARSLFDGKTWIVVYDDSQEKDMVRFLIAHELGHIFLGHAITNEKYSQYKEFQKKPRLEVQADMFAMRLLCPACVLHSLNATDTDEISRLCNVPTKIAAYRHERMRVLNTRNKFLTSPLEQQVYKQFESFISDMKSQRQETPN